MGSFLLNSVLKFRIVLKLVRKERNLTQMVIAERCNLSVNYIGKIERGISIPTFEVFISLCNGLEVKMTDFAKKMEDLNYICESIYFLDLSSLKSMGEMFAYNRLLTSININGIDTSNVTNMKRLFRECESLENINIRHFKTANVTDMSEMFYKCTNLKTINIASTTFEFKKEYDEATQTTNFLVTVTNMFAECPNLQKLYIYDILQMAILNQIYPGFTSLPFEPIQDGEPS